MGGGGEQATGVGPSGVGLSGVDPRGAVGPAEFEEILSAMRSEREAERRELSDSLAVVLDARADGTADDEHDPEGPTLSAEWSRVSGLHTELAAKEDALDRAVARLAAGTFGTCIRCGRPIGIDRLRARPTTEHCIACARELEERTRRR